MGGSPGDVSEEPVSYEKRNKGWRMSCDVGKATEGLENELWSRWSNGKFGERALLYLYLWALLILQTFRHFTYFTTHSPTLLLLLLCHRLFTYVTWWAGHGLFNFIRYQTRSLNLDFISRNLHYLWKETFPLHLLILFKYHWIEKFATKSCYLLHLISLL